MSEYIPDLTERYPEGYRCSDDDDREWKRMERFEKVFGDSDGILGMTIRSRRKLDRLQSLLRREGRTTSYDTMSDYWESWYILWYKPKGAKA